MENLNWLRTILRQLQHFMSADIGHRWQIHNKKTIKEMKIGEGGMGLCLALRFTFLGWMLPTV